MINTNSTKKSTRSPRKKKITIPSGKLSDPLAMHIDNLAKVLSKKIDKEVFARKYAPAKEVLKLVAAGAFIGTSLAIPTLPMALKPFLSNQKEKEVWKRFNIPYLKRTLDRLEKQKMVEFRENNNKQIITITNQGRKKILQYALMEIELKKPAIWDRKWRLISYDIPEDLKDKRDFFKKYLLRLGFYPLHHSVFLHAYPFWEEIEFLREYLGIAKYVRVFLVDKIENDRPFRKFFDI